MDNGSYVAGGITGPIRMVWNRFRKLGIADQVMWVLAILGASMPALDVALKFTPTLSTYLPHFMESDGWRAAPFFLLVAALVLYLKKLDREAKGIAISEAKSALPARQFPKVRYRPEAEFAVLPIYFQIDLTQQLPTVEARFYIVSYLPRPMLVSEISFSLQASSMPSIDDIPLRQKDWRVEPKEDEVIVCSRQLTNAERDLAWSDGRISAATFTLTAKATDGVRTFTYGPVSGMVIEGWVRVPPKKESAEPMSPAAKEMRLKAYQELYAVINAQCASALDAANVVAANWENQIVNSGSDSYIKKLEDMRGLINDSLQEVMKVLHRHDYVPGLSAMVQGSWGKFQAVLWEGIQELTNAIKPPFPEKPDSVVAHLLEPKGAKVVNGVHLFSEWITEIKVRLKKEIAGL